MQAKKRYLLVCVVCVLLGLCYYGFVRFRGRKFSLTTFRQEFAFYIDENDLELDNSVNIRSRTYSKFEKKSVENVTTCRMETCFNFTKCQHSTLKVYVYPYHDADKISDNYRRFLNVIQNSPFYTSNPHEACLFVLALDTIDRDHLSDDFSKDFLHKFKIFVKSSDIWNDGQNHVIFNMFSGTWPDYVEDLDFFTGKAILAKASMSSTNFRPNFDISLPLIAKTHREKGSSRGSLKSQHFPPTKHYFISFKGKRYLSGCGSKTRGSLYHLHNGNDIIMLTTCKHGKHWRTHKDDRCDIDNRAYDKYDYAGLLQNSTFCLVPRGRRIGSYRFLEVLEAGCIPVLVSNGLELPFSEVINWKDAIVWADERAILQIPDVLRSMSLSQMMSLQQQIQKLWQAYFSSIENIVYTTFKIVWERVKRYSSNPGNVWNTLPGALNVDVRFSDDERDFPFNGGRRLDRFTAVVFSTRFEGNLQPPLSSALYKLIENVFKSNHASAIIIVWTNDRRPPPVEKWRRLFSSSTKEISLHIIEPAQKTISGRFYPFEEITTDAVLGLDEDSTLTTEEMDFGFKVWQSFPDRIVGYPARSHYWDSSRSQWSYTSKWLNRYSMVLTRAAFYHRYYNFVYTHHVSRVLRKTVDQSQNCEDVLMNFLVSHITKLPPIKLTRRKQYDSRRRPSDPDHFLQRQACINAFAAVFGYMPLVKSAVRLDPALYKDSVSVFRKKYRRLELVS